VPNQHWPHPDYSNPQGIPYGGVLWLSP